MMHDIQQTLSDLLSLKSTSTQISDALSKLNASLTRLALGLADSSSGDAIEAASFIAAQDGFVQNVTTRLIEFVARSLLRLQNHKYGDDFQAVFVQLGQAMKLLQGFLLLHRASRALFGIACNMELLLTCLTLPDHSAPLPTKVSAFGQSTTISSSPSLTSIPFSFGARASGRDASDTPPPTLSELTLETLLCALVDTPDNVRVFEELGGIGEVVKILRGKIDGGKPAKMKALEFLYFWLYPDTESPPSSANSLSTPTLVPPITPTTPTNPNRRVSARTSLAIRSSGQVRRPSADQRLRSMLESAHSGWSPQTPSKPVRHSDMLHPALARSESGIALSPTKRHSRLAFTHEEEGENEDPIDVHASPRKKTSSSMYGLAEYGAPVRHLEHSPEVVRRRSVLGVSALGAASRFNRTPHQAEKVDSKVQLSRHQRRSSLFTHSSGYRDEDSDDGFKSPRPPPHSPLRGLRNSPSTPQSQHRRMSTSGLPTYMFPKSPSGQISSRPPLSRSSVLAQSTKDLPGGTGVTRGLFASLSPAMSSDSGASPQQTQGHWTDAQLTSITQHRRQVLAKYVGNVDQLLERFQVMRVV